MKRTAWSIAVLCIALCIPVARAGGAGTVPRGDFAEKMFEKMDANGDGAVTRKEFEAFNDKRFDEMDANRDGKITRAEIEAARDGARKKRAEQMREQFKRRFDAADANHDGELSREEVQALPRVAQHFDEIDANHDGKLAPAELSSYLMRTQHAQAR